MNLVQLTRKLKKLGTESAEALLAEIEAKVDAESRIGELRKQRAELVKRIREVDAEIAKLGGSKRGKRGGRKRDRSQPTLVQRAIDALSRTPQGLRITDLARRIREAGHQTASEPRTFATAVYLAIKNDKRIRRISKGVYALREKFLAGKGAASGGGG